MRVVDAFTCAFHKIAMSLHEPTHHSATWSLDNIKKLIELWREHPAGKIAALLGVTRNAVIGKANRMHLERKPNNPSKPKPVREPRFIPKPPVPPPPAPVVLPKAPPSLGLTIYEIADDECRYAEGDGPPFLFCGHAVAPGSSYCPYHKRLCYFPLSPVRRDWRISR